MGHEHGPCEEGPIGEGQWIEFDLSSLNYSGFIRFFFDRPVVDEKLSFELFKAEQFGVDSTCYTNPAATLRNVSEMCRRFEELTRVYSFAQLDQGLWAMFGHQDCLRNIFDEAVDLQVRVDCIRSMYIPFREVRSRYAGDSKDFYGMWWDMILFPFGRPSKYKSGERILTDDQQHMINVIFETLTKILALPHRGCQVSALHGLGHLYHPAAAELIDAYIKQHRGELTEKEIEYALACRDNKVQ
jgi:hypothetical protein